MKRTGENAVVRACLEYLGYRGIYSWRSNNVPVYDPARKRFRAFVGLPGVADILGLLAPSGRFLAVECKSGRNTQSKAQVAFGQSIQRAGGLYLCVWDVRDLEQGLKREGY